MDALKPCPSCRGAAELIPFSVACDSLWQVTCSQCGMATELEEERSLCISRWNRRDKEQRLGTAVLVLSVCLPAGLALMFMTGVMVGGILLDSAGAGA
ncbi:MAG: Lar family restriction alleviation protein [Kistimonas sp.]|nr:Lar family restriction alleviation protein [Kistimonas sp.]